MHYKDGTPALLGDIVKHDSGSVGIVIGGLIGSDSCSTQVVMFKSPANSNAWDSAGAGFVGALKEINNVVKSLGAVRVSFDSSVQTSACLKIGHMDIGHG